MDKRFIWETHPKALPENIVKGENYRFTVLTSKLIRLEYSKDGVFEDRASQSVFYRDFAPVKYSVSNENEILTIVTDAIKLQYKIGNDFNGNLKLNLLEEPAGSWVFGDEFEELGGTSRTLDSVNGELPLGRGVCARRGFSVLDDSKRMLLNDEGWVEVRHPDTLDVYFFGYGFDYIGAVKDFYRLTGAPPMLPAYALGNWWSRYYAYSQDEYIALMDRFKEENIPFSVGVIDMDWHTTVIPENLKNEYLKYDKRLATGWTGYTWNEELFPNYKEFIKQIKERNLSVALNLHPAGGVRKHESMFNDMAEYLGVDADKTNIIPFNILSPEYMKAYFDVIHHPYEKDGIDFWWMDFQQGREYWWLHSVDGKEPDEREVLDPLWMLNHLHILDISRNGKRPMFFSRYSGPGSHRYPVGFSGDTIVTWDSLKFQPYFTATASNIGYSWWSHDIGGHAGGYCDDELFVRWVQLGVFSPINRLHSCANELMRKEPWCYSGEVEGILKDWLKLRHRMFPYIYTMNYRNHNELLPMIQPMYYSHPMNDAAYSVPTQYWFGSELIVSPIAEHSDKVDTLSKTEVWLPKGDWFDFFDGTHYVSENGRKMKIFRSLKDYPVFAKQGAIVPMAVFENNENRLFNSEEMDVFVFPGADNTFTLFEDEGEYDNFEKGKFATTKFSLKWGKQPCFTIGATNGDVSLIPRNRKWNINFRGFNKDINVKVYVDGKLIETEEVHDCKTHTVKVTVATDITKKIEIHVVGQTLLNNNDDVIERCYTLLQHSQIGYMKKRSMYKTICSEHATIHKKLFDFSCLNIEYSEQHLVDAIKELLTLQKEEFDGFDIG